MWNECKVAFAVNIIYQINSFWCICTVLNKLKKTTSSVSYENITWSVYMCKSTAPVYYCIIWIQIYICICTVSNEYKAISAVYVLYQMNTKLHLLYMYFIKWIQSYICCICTVSNEYKATSDVYVLYQMNTKLCLPYIYTMSSEYKTISSKVTRRRKRRETMELTTPGSSNRERLIPTRRQSLHVLTPSTWTRTVSRPL